MQHAAFHADKQVRRTTMVLKVVSKPEEVKPGNTVTWSDEVKDLPPVQPTRLGGGCKLIDLKYQLTVSGHHRHRRSFASQTAPNFNKISRALFQF